MSHIIADADASGAIASGLESVDLSSGPDVPLPGVTTVMGMVYGTMAGKSLKSAFDNLMTVIGAKADNIRQIQAIFQEADARLAQGLPE